MTIVASLLAFAGLVLLALSMPRHHARVFGAGSPPSAPWVKVAGWLLLTLSFAPCLVIAAFSLAILRWFGVLTFAALAVVLLMSYRPTLLRHAVSAGVASAVLAGVAAFLVK
ncbi:MAG: DUF3325 domain-containing protein [Candidatus Accumulibacter sp.]|jgi:hypothetical protein|nr:DUF3325 domain-containing protein [Accumulibacter sp.]